MEIEKNIKIALDKLNKHKDIKKINSFLIEFLNNYIQNNYKIIEKPINKMFVFNRNFYEYIISELPKFIDSNSYYKEFEKLKKYYIIHTKSASFPLTLRLISINPNHQCLLKANLKKLNIFQNLKESLKNNILLNLEIKDIYTYLRFFSIRPFSKNKLSQIKHCDIIKAKEDLAFIFFNKENKLSKLVNENIEKQIQTYYLEKLDKFISNKILKLYDIESTIFIFNNNSSDIEYFEQYAQEFKDLYLNIDTNQIKFLNQIDFLQKSNGLKLSLETKIVKSVQLTIKEIQVVYPNHKISSKIVDIEENLYSFLFNQTKYNNEIIEINDEDSNYLNIYDIPLFKLFLKANNTHKITNQKIRIIINEYLTASESPNLEIIRNYLFELLDRNKNRNNFSLSTMNNYLSSLNKYLFKNIEDFKNIKETEINKIEKLIERFIVTKGSYKNLQIYFNDFFTFTKLNNIFSRRLILLNYPKSLILKKEVDLILCKIEETYKNKQNIEKLTFIHKRNILDLRIIFLISYYTGLRKSEVYTRLYKDIKIIFNNEQMNLFIDVNKDGLKALGKDLKTKTSKRNICSIINNEKHKELFITWYNTLKELLDKKIKRSKLNEIKKIQKLKNSNIFINNAKKVNDRVIKYESNISIITEAIKLVTKRYCTFHSCRHSYQTYKYKEILSKEQNDPYLAIEQSILLGHRTPTMGINSYTHYDIIDDI